MPIKSYKVGPGTFKLNVPRTVADVTTTNASTTITSTVAAFISGDVGVPIAGVGIPVAATIAAVLSPTEATISEAATADGTVAVTITPAALTDPSCQLRSGVYEVTENATTVDAVPHLCGEDLAAEEDVTYTHRFKASLTQDFSTGGFIDFSHANKGTVVWGEYVPSTALGRKVSGPFRVAPLPIGGDVKSRPAHDLDWAMPTVEPVLGSV